LLTLQRGNYCACLTATGNAGDTLTIIGDLLASVFLSGLAVAIACSNPT